MTLAQAINFYNRRVADQGANLDLITERIDREIRLQISLNRAVCDWEFVTELPDEKTVFNLVKTQYETWGFTTEAMPNSAEDRTVLRLSGWFPVGAARKP